MIKLSKYAKENDISYLTAYRYYRSGNLKGKQLHSGTILIYEDENNNIISDDKLKVKKVILYARVSSSENKSNLESQLIRLRNYASAKGYTIIKEITEIGSGINDKRLKLENVLKNNNDWDLIIVEHKDRLARFGINYIKILLNNINKDIEIINSVETEKEDIMQDFVSIITSFCSKIYGLRRSKRKTEEIINNLNK